MNNQGQEFTNNFNNYESTRFDFGIAMLMTLFSKENQDILNKKIREQLIDVQTIEDSESLIKGLIYANETDDMDKSRIFYLKHNGDKVAYSWHVMVHELAHFMGKPDKETIENEIIGNSDKSELGGTQIFDFNTNSEYGKFFNECGADLICEMAMTNSVECRETNPQIKLADDIIYTNNRYQKTEYDSLSTMARLMAVAMDNNFSKQSYDQMIHSDSGLIDRQVQMINQETGEVLDTVPINDYLYAMAGHGKHLEEQFDKYSETGRYREMCSFLDEELKVIQTGQKHITDKNKLKEQLLRMADMVNNKMYILQSNKCITQEQKNAFVGRFNLVFNQALQEYNIGALTQEDIQKTTQSMNQTKNRENASVQSKNIVEEKNIVEQTEINMPEGYSINEFGEIIRPEQVQQHIEMDNDIPIFMPPNETQQVEQYNQQNENKLTIRQRVARFLQKNQALMNISFIEKFVDKQLNVLPSASQIPIKSVNSQREEFINMLTNSGEYRNLPPLQIMPDQNKTAEMKRNTEQYNKLDDDGR